MQIDLQNQRLGIDIDTTTLEIKCILDGPVLNHNQEHPTKAIYVGDRLVEINGVKVKSGESCAEAIARSPTLSAVLERRKGLVASDGKRTAATPGSFKWSLEELETHLLAKGRDYALMMSRIKELIVKALLAVEPAIVSTWHQGASFASAGCHQAPRLGPNQSCFEIYGFDVIIDDNLRPWLLEVNILPSLSSSSPYDKRVKTKLIADVLTLVGFSPFSHERVDKAMRAECAGRLQGFPSKTQVGRSHSVQTVGSACLKELGEAEWRLILEAHDEYMRRGGLERIFPTTETAGSLGALFASQRYSNLVLARWLQLGGEQLFLPERWRDLPAWLPRQLCFDSC